MTSLKDVYYVAGLVEGEGHIGFRKLGAGKAYVLPHITVTMTDRDVIENLHRVWGSTSKIYHGKGRIPGRHKDVYRTVVWGKRAVAWGLTLYTLLGQRRREQVKKMLQAWRSRGTRQHPRPRGR